jgi:hypothetical protein
VGVVGSARNLCLAFMREEPQRPPAPAGSSPRCGAPGISQLHHRMKTKPTIRSSKRIEKVNQRGPSSSRRASQIASPIFPYLSSVSVDAGFLRPSRPERPIMSRGGPTKKTTSNLSSLFGGGLGGLSGGSK